MLEHLGLTEEARTVEQAVEKEITSRQELTDNRTTSEIGDAIVALLA